MSANRFVTISLSQPENLINDSDQLAESEGISRAKVIGIALRSYIGADINAQDLDTGLTPLQWALNCNREPLAAFLKNRGGR